RIAFPAQGMCQQFANCRLVLDQKDALFRKCGVGQTYAPHSRNTRVERPFRLDPSRRERLRDVCAPAYCAEERACPRFPDASVPICFSHLCRRAISTSWPRTSKMRGCPWVTFCTKGGRQSSTAILW